MSASTSFFRSNPTRSIAPTAALFACLAVGLYFYLSLFAGVLLDDAFITLRYVRTLETTGTWGFFPGYTANTATSPLNVLLLLLMSALTGSPTSAVLWLTLLELLSLAWLLKMTAAQLELPVFGWLAFVGVAANPWLISTMGLEGLLIVLFLSAAAFAFVSERFDALALACALLTLSRADGVLLAIVVAAFLPSQRRLRFIVIFAAAITPWFLFSWWRLGSFVPDSLLLKANDPWGDYTFANGLTLYRSLYPLQTRLSFIALPAALLALMMERRRLGPIVWILAGYAGLHFAAYSWLRAGPSHWYYVPEVASCVLLGSLGISVWCRNLGQRSRLASRLAGALVCSVPVAGMCALLASYGLPLKETLVHANWATPGMYRTVGEWLKEHHRDEVGIASTEIGTLAYYCDCQLVNQFGDRAWLTGRIAHSKEAGGLESAWARINYFFYKPQPAFAEPTYWLTVQQTPDAAAPDVPPWRISSRWRSPQWLTWTAQSPGGTN